MSNKSSSIDLAISSKAKSFLRGFGWSEDRIERLDAYSSGIMKRGFRSNSVAEQIVRQLEGITFTTNVGGVAWFRFGHQECFHTFRHDHVSILEALVEETDPCPIGGGGGYILFAFPTGVFALLQEQWLCLLISHSFGAMVDAMIFNDSTGCRVMTDVESYRPDW